MEEKPAPSNKPPQQTPSHLPGWPIEKPLPNVPEGDPLKKNEPPPETTT
jgi:hypothetical protein